MKRNKQGTTSRITLLVFSLIVFSSCASAQHVNSNQPMGHHTESAATPDSSGNSEVSQDWAKQRLAKSPRHQEWVKIKYKPAGKTTEREVSAFVVYPEVKTKATAVIVIHEIFGMSDWVQSLTDQLAEAGYVAIAPDLLSGMGPNGGGTDAIRAQASDAVGKAIRDLPPDQITADLNAVADYVANLPAANGKIAITGYCWGGTQSFRYATNNAKLKAAFVFYGSAPMKEDQKTADEQAMARIKAPVYGFYAGNDARINATLPATVEAIKKVGKTFEPVTYEGAGHGFMRAGDAPEPAAPVASGNAEADKAAMEKYQQSLTAYKANKKARDDAWVRWKTILAKL
jgi:carboxymethylenebutenolidase